MNEIKGLYFITDSKLSKNGIVQGTKDVIEGGCRIVQYREKEKTTREMAKETMELAGICEQNGALFIVNNRVDLAMAANASGVHLGQDDMPVEMALKLLGKEKIIGVTVHSLEEAVQAQKDGADYVSISPIFETTTKPDAGKPTGLELVREAKRKVRVPIVAIGGINEKNVLDVIAAGADSVAIISGILNSDSVKETTARIVGIINDAAAKR